MARRTSSLAADDRPASRRNWTNDRGATVDAGRSSPTGDCAPARPGQEPICAADTALLDLD